MILYQFPDYHVVSANHQSLPPPGQQQKQQPATDYSIIPIDEAFLWLSSKKYPYVMAGCYPQKLQPKIRREWSECSTLNSLLKLLPVVTEKVYHIRTPTGGRTLPGKFCWNKFATISVKTIIPCNKDNPIMS